MVEGWIQPRYIIRTSINVTIYPYYNNRITKRLKKKKSKEEKVLDPTENRNYHAA
jgi:hypothetical protein